MLSPSPSPQSFPYNLAIAILACFLTLGLGYQYLSHSQGEPGEVSQISPALELAEVVD